MTARETTAYRIHVNGAISERWIKWFGNMALAAEKTAGSDGRTVVQVEVPDQAALLVTLQKLHNLGYTLTEVRMVVNDESVKGGKDDAQLT